jgi:hypothetical protein
LYSAYCAQRAQSGGRFAGVKREIKIETTGSFAYNFSVLKKEPEEPNFSVNRTALKRRNNEENL